MSVTVKHLNADSTFLLIFSPESNPSQADLRSTNGAYSVLIDPWLVGSSIVAAPWFAITHRVAPGSIQHLSEIEEPDVVLVSQNKPDHCHKETLLQLSPEGKTIIASEPGAAKAIKSWNHFDPNRVHGLSKYDPKARFGNLLRLWIPPLSPLGHAGEINIAFIPAKNYMTGLHNAFGITYLPPTKVRSLAPVSTIDLPRLRYFHLPHSPATLPPASPPSPLSPVINRPLSLDLPSRDHSRVRGRTSVFGHRPRTSLSKSSKDGSHDRLPVPEQRVGRPQTAPSETSEASSVETIIPDRSPQLDIPFDFEKDQLAFVSDHTLPTPPESPLEIAAAVSFPGVFHSRKSYVGSNSPSISSTSPPIPATVITPARPRPLSVLYTPHGLPYQDLQPYIQNHLVRFGALPLTLLLHSFDHTQNPWYFGGNIMRGASGGSQIARALMARCWLSAHDELKDDQGFSVRQLKVKHLTAEDVRRELYGGEDGQGVRKNGWVCDVRNLDVGREIVIGQARDLCAGMDVSGDAKLMTFGVI